MAGSYGHITNEDGTKYIGVDLLENMGDMHEAVEMMAFMLLAIRHRWGGHLVVPGLADDYYRCLRGEVPWPEWFDRSGE